MPELFCVVYVSTATREMGASDLERILLQAQAHNESVGVSGMLLYDHGHFMQYLEGPTGGLTAALVKVRAARQHSGMVELLRERISGRAFPGWAMAFRSPQAFAMSDPRLQGDALAHVPDPVVEVTSPATLLLARFWNRGRFQRAF